MLQNEKLDGLGDEMVVSKGLVVPKMMFEADTKPRHYILALGNCTGDP